MSSTGSVMATSDVPGYTATELYPLGRGLFGDMYRHGSKVTERDSESRCLEILPSLNDGRESPLALRQYQELWRLPAKHTRIVHYEDCFLSADGRICIVREVREDGVTLNEYLLRCPLTTADGILKGIGDVSSALAFLHEHGITHGELRPGTVLVYGDGDCCKITGFGLAQIVADLQHRGSLRDYYMRASDRRYFIAPETLDDDYHTRATDVFQAGAMFAAMLVRASGTARGLEETTLRRNIAGRVTRLVTLYTTNDTGFAYGLGESLHGGMVLEYRVPDQHGLSGELRELLDATLLMAIGSRPAADELADCVSRVRSAAESPPVDKDDVDAGPPDRKRGELSSPPVWDKLLSSPWTVRLTCFLGVAICVFAVGRKYQAFIHK